MTMRHAVCLFATLHFLILLAANGCKTAPKDHPTLNYDVNPPEILQDPEATPPGESKETAELSLTTSTTPCVTQISRWGTKQDAIWRDAYSRFVMQRICNKDPKVAKIWRTDKQYSPNSWVAGVNLTAVTLNVPRGTAITPRHVVYTKHYGYHGQIGQILNFLTVDNRVVSRKIIAVKYLSNNFNPDVAVIQLESDLPGSITPIKVLDPFAANTVALYSPLLRIDQENKALIVQASPYGAEKITNDSAYNPPGTAFSLYYEDMITGDSSSPSILLMNSPNGVMPILFGLVTFAGPGQGPRIGQLVPQIQAAIKSFGDSHKIVTAPPPFAAVAAPTCSMMASRIGKTANCNLTVTASADHVAGSPIVTPNSPLNWTRSGNVWSGSAPCSTTSATTFQAIISGQGGSGRACESPTVAPL